MKIYTKTGDTGQTSLINGNRVSKANIRIDAYGNVDELNSWVGLLGDFTINDPKKDILRQIQNDLFIIGSNLANNSTKPVQNIPLLKLSHIKSLEQGIDEIETELTPMKNFILPGGHKEVSHAHIARTVCRRAERGVVKLSESEQTDELIITYLNRLSDLLFVLCRWMSKRLGVEEIPWTPNK